MKNYRKVKVNKAATGEGNRSVITIALVSDERAMILGHAYYIAPSQDKMRNTIDTMIDTFGAEIINGMVTLSQAQIDKHAKGDLENLGLFIVSDYQPAKSSK